MYQFSSSLSSLQVMVDVMLQVNEAPVIGIIPDSMHFSMVKNSKDSMSFSIFNAGMGPLEIFNIEV